MTMSKVMVVIMNIYKLQSIGSNLTRTATKVRLASQHVAATLVRAILFRATLKHY